MRPNSECFCYDRSNKYEMDGLVNNVKQGEPLNLLDRRRIVPNQLATTVPKNSCNILSSLVRSYDVSTSAKLYYRVLYLYGNQDISYVYGYFVTYVFRNYFSVLL